MIKYNDIVVGMAYHVCGNRYRVFDGKNWHDCDQHGNVLTR